MKHIFSAKKNYTKLSGFLSEELGFLPLSAIKKQIREGEVKVNGKKTPSDAPLLSGDEVSVFLPAALKPKETEPVIVYEDENIAVADKPVLCETEIHLQKAMKKRYAYAAPVHRLDRNTRGLVIFALNAESEAELLRLIKERKIEKFYRARVYGIVSPPAREVTVYLKKDPAESKVKISGAPQKGYVPAILSYRTVKADGEDTVLDIRLITGRTHQIRATMAYLGYPVIGDGKYGAEKINRPRKAKYQRLTAYKIRFDLLNEQSILSYLDGKEIICQNYEQI